MQFNVKSALTVCAVAVLLSAFGQYGALFCPAKPHNPKVPARSVGILSLKDRSLYFGVTSPAMLRRTAESSPSVA